MNRFKLLTAMMLVLAAPQARSQQDRPDSSNFISYFDKILIKCNLSTQSDRYSIIDKAGQDVDLRANTEYRAFLSLDYEFIGFSYGFSPRFLRPNNDDQLKGRSSFRNYKLQFFPGQFLQTVAYDRTKGYYVKNTGDFVPGWIKGTHPYIQIPDLKVTQWSGSTSYILNRDFSFKNLIYQTQWQKRSAGSLVPSLFYDYTRYSLALFDNTSRQEDFHFRAGLGYYYTWIIGKHFFVSPNLLPSLGLRYSDFTTESNGVREHGTKFYFTRYLEGGIKLGFNTSRWVAGGGLNFNINWYNESRSMVVQNDKIFGILYLGYRFNTPGFIKRAHKELMKHLP